MSLLFPFQPPLADWSGPGLWILLVPLVWFAFALAFVLVLRRFAWGRGWGPGPGCGRARGSSHDRTAGATHGAPDPVRRWEEDDAPSTPGEPWRRP